MAVNASDRTERLIAINAERLVTAAECAEARRHVFYADVDDTKAEEMDARKPRQRLTEGAGSTQV